MKLLLQSFQKLNPLFLVRNPVLFLTEVGVLVSLLEWGLQPTESHAFYAQIALWLLLTLLFANFSESMAEERNRAQAESLRKGRVETMAHRRGPDGQFQTVHASQLRKGDVVRVAAGELVPSDGEIIEGSASIDESAITGESAPVIRAAGTDRDSVTAGTKLLSDQLLVRIAADPGHSFLDRMVDLIETAKRRKSANEIALTLLFTGLSAILLIVVVSMPLFGLYFQIRFSATLLVALLVCLIPTTIAGLFSAIGIAGINRLMKKNVLAMTGQAVEAAGDVDLIFLDKTGTITQGQRQVAGVSFARGVEESEFMRAAILTSLQDATSEGRGIVDYLKTHYVPWVTVPEGMKVVSFTAQTRMSGVDLRDERLRKGAVDAVEKFAGQAMPVDLHEVVQRACAQGGTPLLVGSHRRILGVILLKDVVKKGLTPLFARFRTMGIQTIMMTGDNPLTARAIAQEAGLDQFFAEISPEQKLAKVIEMQRKGLMVAMTGDGTNDAPALAQADVGVAMHTGTQAAKEAGNMIDLDSHPEKLFEIIEVGKQMLITRGALTTFSLANDLSKYFAILPAMLSPYFPSMQQLNIMRLSSSESAVVSAVIFNALIIPALIPLAFRGVKMPTTGVLALLRRNLLIYGLGGVLVPFLGIKAIDLLVGVFL